MSRLLCLAALALGVLLLVPAGAGAAIVVNASIARVSPGMTEKQVRSRLGRPASVQRPGSVAIYRYKKRKLTITFYNRRALLVQTASRRQRTASGVGVGSSRSAVQSGIRGVDCAEGPFAQCVTSGKGRMTTFQLANNRVAAVSLQDA